MKHIGRLAVILILVFNLLIIGLLLFSAYSPYVDPRLHPMRACMGLTFPIFLVLNGCFLVLWLIFRIKLALVPFLAFLICFPQIRTYMPVNFRTADLPEGSIKLLSYNVMSFGGSKKEEGKNAVLTYLQESKADIICIQEFIVSADQKHVTQKDVDTALKAYPYKHIQKIGNGYNGLACYSKYPILSAKKIKYHSDYNGSMVYEIKINADTITLINNHLESNKLTKEDKMVYEGMLRSPEVDKVKTGLAYLVRKLGEAQKIRADQACAVEATIKASVHPYVIVCGDFNDSPISYAHRIIEKDMDDAFTASGCGLGISYNQNKFYFRIDNILVSKHFKTFNCTVDHTIKDSDHYPIWCDICKR